jgi:hypothetical protein
MPRKSLLPWRSAIVALIVAVGGLAYLGLRHLPMPAARPRPPSSGGPRERDPERKRDNTPTLSRALPPRP